MKIFKIKGWYKYEVTSGSNVMTTTQKDSKDAVFCFCEYYKELNFYKIIVEEI
tara:strand:+ start:59 stop:217 length:159 start_codon:yes stop_codon:yes gene_type:complete